MEPLRASIYAARRFRESIQYEWRHGYEARTLEKVDFSNMCGAVGYEIIVE